MADVTLRGVSRSFGSAEVIHGVDLEIKNGEFAVLVGPSGCGKSTLLRMIAGLETLTKGELSIGHDVVNELSPKDRDIAMVFQNHALYPHMSVCGNLGFSLKLSHAPKDKADKFNAKPGGAMRFVAATSGLHLFNSRGLRIAGDISPATLPRTRH